MVIKFQRMRDYFFLGIFVLFCISKVGNIKYVLAMMYAAFYFLKQYAYGTPLSMRNAGKAYFIMFLGMCGLFVITIVLQLKNGFQSYAVNEVIYFITPLFLVWVYMSMTNRDRLEKILDYMLYILIASFIYLKLPYLSFRYLKYINFANSFSIFECGYGYPSVILECVFLMRGDRKKAAVAMVLAVLCFKRFNMVAAVLIFVLSGWIISDKPVKKVAIFATVLGYVLLPAITCEVLDNDFFWWFQQKFGVDLAQITMTRSDRIMAVVNSDEIKYGLGSTTMYMTEMLNSLHNTETEQRNLHNDLVRIYVECGLLGSAIFTYASFKAVETSRTAFVIMCYIFAECYFNHPLGAGSVYIWVVVYMSLAYVIGNNDKTTHVARVGGKYENSDCKNNTEPGQPKYV